eukprot:TRINITY_DN16461_c0_g1_i2.p1 TRINITY_DN16461_c0_g1~~TRINITY_DN16461_c0_g1_i2.p1  ORF type:complete len:292 (+),score=41.18 TRINITY_DN16461_c0_g1_i2:183-1058(+)
MYYNFTPNRETLNNEMFKLDANELLSNCELPADDELNGVGGYSDNILEGLYNLALPSSIFNQIGIYTIYIKPKTVATVISDCSVLSSLPTVRGIIVDINTLDTKLAANDALQGFRVEFINSDGTKMRNVVRHVVTSNKVVPVNENIGNTSQKSTRYRFDDSGTKLFLQLTPSSSSDVKSNSYPFMGNIGQTILLTNTNFSPVAVEVEMVANTIDTVANAILGEEIKDVQAGILTKFDENREITNQYDLYEIKSDVGDEPLYEVKEKRTNIDASQNFDNVLNDIQQKKTSVK